MYFYSKFAVNRKTHVNEKNHFTLVAHKLGIATYALTTGILAYFFSTADNVFSIHIFPRLLIISWL